MVLSTRILAIGALAALLLVAAPAHAHLIQDGAGCSSGLVPIYTTPNWVLTWAQNPVDWSNVTSDPAGHGLNAVARLDDPCIQVIWPCQVRLSNPCIP